MSRALVSLRRVRLSWGAREAVRSVDLDVHAGEFVGVVGPNGAGKTTLLRLMGKLLEPTGGALWLDGQALAALGRRTIARSVAVVPQTAPIDFAFSVRDVVLMGRHPHLGRFQGEGPEDHAAARGAMEITATVGFAERSITELSAGERQRVMLARALAQCPRLLLLDEPTANLDLRHQLQILDCVRRRVREAGLAAVAALHDLGLASRYCDRLVLMHAGRVVADGMPDEVLTSERLRAVFGVTAHVARSALTGGLSISVVAASEEAAVM
ncbi:MAG: ABC transporter ATP-binding protein [Candidatus Rokuibacteriota bacterium]